MKPKCTSLWLSPLLFLCSSALLDSRGLHSINRRDTYQKLPDTKQRTETNLEKRSSVGIDKDSKDFARNRAELSRHMNQLHKQLHLFFNDKQFDVLHFDSLKTKYFAEFSWISYLFKEAWPRPACLTHQFIFIHTLLETMCLAAQINVDAKFTGDTSDELTFRVIEIRVMSMSLFDSFGCPDTEIDWYAEKVHNLIARLHVLGDKAKAFNGSAPSSYMIFYNQFSRAESTLGVLKGHIPPHQ